MSGQVHCRTSWRAGCLLGNADLNDVGVAIRNQDLSAVEAFAFAEYLAFSPVIPFEASPLEAASLAGMLTSASGMSAGAAAGFLAAGPTPLALVTVPAGMIIGGAAAGVARALEEGLRSRIMRRLGVGESEDETRSA